MDILNVINLDKREDRLLSVAKQAKWQNIPLRIWNGIDAEPTTAQGINKAHKQIVQFAKDNNQHRVIIAEDDIIFTADNAYAYFLSQMPSSYDLFFAMSYSAEIKENKILNGFSGMTMYVVHEKFYDFFLGIPDHVHIDRFLGQFAFEREYLLCEPYVALQSGGYSENLRREMHYEAYTDTMKFYGREEGEVFRRGSWVTLPPQ